MKAREFLWIVLLLVLAFGQAAAIDKWFQGWRGNRADAGNLLEVLIGDARKMFSNHFFLKADAYFHAGYYPSIFDNKESFQTAHIAEDSGAMEGLNEGDEDSFMGKPKDWIDRFNRHFYPSVHVHLDQVEEARAGEDPHEGHDHHDHDEEPESSGGLEREMLPWLKFSASLDPNRVETYVVASYWLRERMGKIREAKEFLRDGLRANPKSYEILFELGRLYRENEKDTTMARNIWELAWKYWRDQEVDSEDPDIFMALHLVSSLAVLEEETERYPQALHYLEIWKNLSPKPELIQDRIQEVQLKMGTPTPLLQPVP